MDVIRHDHVAADRPTVAFSSGTPLLQENGCDGPRNENFSPPKGARRHEIDRIFNPNPVEAPEVTMHGSVVAGIVDPGHSENRLSVVAGIADPGLCQIVVYSGAGITDPGYN